MCENILNITFIHKNKKFIRSLCNDELIELVNGCEWKDNDEIIVTTKDIYDVAKSDPKKISYPIINGGRNAYFQIKLNSTKKVIANFELRIYLCMVDHTMPVIRSFDFDDFIGEYKLEIFNDILKITLNQSSKNTLDGIAKVFVRYLCEEELIELVNGYNGYNRYKFDMPKKVIKIDDIYTYLRDERGEWKNGIVYGGGSKGWTEIKMHFTNGGGFNAGLRIYLYEI